MITSNSRDQQLDSPTKEEANSTSDGQVANKASSGSSAAPWLRLKDPRVVRVSRAFGGKDRHSKVCTIRGLKDRRVRLSVPTAIQLYDLQDRLGFNQPSKVVDWLLNAAKNEIDELPPLPIPPGSFFLNQLPMVSSSYEVGTSHLNKEGFKLNKGVEWEELPRPNTWNSETSLKAKAREVERDSFDGKENWMKRSWEDKQEGKEGNSAQVSTSSFLSRAGQSSPGFVSNAVTYGSFFNLEPANFSMSHLGSHGFASQTEDPHVLNVVPSPSTLSLSSGSQVLVCPPGLTQSYFPATSMEIDPKQINHFQMLASSTQNLFPNSLNPSPYSLSQSMRPFHFSVTPRLHSENEADKNQEFHAND